MSDLTPILILAAGGSTRLGHPKQLVDFKGEPMLRHAARTALAADTGPVLVVLGASANLCAGVLHDLPVRMIVNANWRQGISWSIRAGIEQITAMPVHAATIMLCDQPEIPALHLQNLAAACNETTQAAATFYDGVIGVPATFHRQLFQQLLTLTGDNGAKEVLRRRERVCVAIPLPEAALDVDTPTDAARLQSKEPHT